MQTGIVRTADGLLLPGFGPLAMFKILVEAALSPFKRSPAIVVRTRVGLQIMQSTRPTTTHHATTTQLEPEELQHNREAPT